MPLTSNSSLNALRLGGEGDIQRLLLGDGWQSNEEVCLFVSGFLLPFLAHCRARDSRQSQQHKPSFMIEAGTPGVKVRGCFLFLLFPQFQNFELSLPLPLTEPGAAAGQVSLGGSVRVAAAGCRRRAACEWLIGCLIDVFFFRLVHTQCFSPLWPEDGWGCCAVRSSRPAAVEALGPQGGLRSLVT